MTVVRAIESFVCPDGSVGTGDLLDSSDPLVKGREHLFEEIKAPEKGDVLLNAVQAPPEETDSEGSIEAAEAGEEAADVEDAPAAGLKTTSTPRGRRSRK